MTNTPSPTDEDRELIERLRQMHTSLDGYGALTRPINPDGPQAADRLGPSGFDPGRVRELAECLKQTVGLARAYSHGTGSIFEDAMTNAERLAERTILECREMTQGAQSERTGA